MPRTLLDVAPSIATVLGIRLEPGVQGSPLPYAGMLSYHRWDDVNGGAQTQHETSIPQQLLIIVDSLSSSIYENPEMPFFHLRRLAENGECYTLMHVSSKTTPAIASILCGVYPERHKVMRTADVKLPQMKSVLEIASKLGVPCAMVTEKEGAEAFKKRIMCSVGVPDSEDILSYDEEIIKRTREILDTNKYGVVCTHLRTLDRTAHRTPQISKLKEACGFIDSLIWELISELKRETIVMICGDHIIHTPEPIGTQQTIPLVVSPISHSHDGP